MNIVYSEQFRAELCCVAGRYHAEDQALAVRFVTSVESAAMSVESDPMRWRLFDGRVRRCLVPGFPFIIYYLVEDDVLYIGALLHTARHPETYRAKFENL